MRLLLCASFITLIALLTFGTSALAKTLEDRCLPAVGTAIYRYGIAYSRIIQEGQAQSDITSAYEGTQLAIALDCDLPALRRGMDCIIKHVGETGKKPDIGVALNCAIKEGPED